MINSLKNEVEIIDRYDGNSGIPKFEEVLSWERRYDKDRLAKWGSYQIQLKAENNLGEPDSYSLANNHNNHHLKYANITGGQNLENKSRDYRYRNPIHKNNYNNMEGECDTSANLSHELGPATRFKNMLNSTSMGYPGPVKFPYILGGGSPVRNNVGSANYNKASAHHYSVSETSNYAIGVGKTNSSNNLKATVSGGKLYVSGTNDSETNKRIEMRCSPDGKVTKVTPSKLAQDEGDPQYHHYYHKFRQQTTMNALSDRKPSRPLSLSKNKFPLPFTGIEYPFIDGGGITSSGREGIYANNKSYIQSYNDFEKSWLYSLPDKFTWTPNERPTYKKKANFNGKMNKVVYDCLNSSPYYNASYETEHCNMIDLNREYVMHGSDTLEDIKSKTTGLALQKDKYYSYLLPYYALEDHSDTTLIFESRFESGNLRRAFK